MEIYQGKSVFGGVAIGRLHVYNKKKLQVKREHIEDAEKEVKRFLDAKDAAIKQLAGLYEKSLSTVGITDAAVFEIHQMMLQDSAYLVSIESIIRTKQVNAEYAV